MIPTPRLFRSRWAALLWAGGIVWMAYDVADSAPRETGNAIDASGEVVSPVDLAAVANAAGL